MSVLQEHEKAPLLELLKIVILWGIPKPPYELANFRSNAQIFVPVVNGRNKLVGTQYIRLAYFLPGLAQDTVCFFVCALYDTCAFFVSFHNIFEK